MLRPCAADSVWCRKSKKSAKGGRVNSESQEFSPGPLSGTATYTKGKNREETIATSTTSSLNSKTCLDLLDFVDIPISPVILDQENKRPSTLQMAENPQRAGAYILPPPIKA